MEERAMIELDGLKKYFSISKGLIKKTKSYVKAVDDITMTINEGEIVGLVGESGSGKTTLARTLLSLTKMTGGDVYVHGASKAEARQKAKEVLELVKMDERYLDSYPHQLSGGQLQRIAIARALALNPKIMILDEPTSALDISVQAQILNLLLDLQETLHLTYLVITHDLNVIKYLSDKIAVMYLGKLVEFGPTAEVANNPKHPYTWGLMSSAPILDPTLRDREKQLLSGDPGSLIKIGDGCRFCDRCQYATEECKSSQPETEEVSQGHQVACFHPLHI